MSPLTDNASFFFNPATVVYWIHVHNEVYSKKPGFKGSILVYVI